MLKAKSFKSLPSTHRQNRPFAIITLVVAASAPLQNSFAVFPDDIPAIAVPSPTTDVGVNQTTTVEHLPASNGATSSTTPSNGSPANGTTAKTSSNGNAANATGSDECKNSVKIDGNYTCDSTYNWIDNAKLANTIGQAGGAAVVNTAGQLGSAKAVSAGTQRAALEAAANTQQNAGGLQTTLGLANTAMGIYQIQMANDHKKYQQQLKNGKIDDNGKALENKLTDQQNNTATAVNVTANQFQNTNGTSMASQDSATAAKQAATKMNQYTDEAINEQKKAQKAAMTAGVQSTIQGVQQTLAGALAIAAANQAKAMAATLSDVTGTSFQLPTANVFVPGQTTGSTTAINPGVATDPAMAAASGNLMTGSVPTIAPPINPDTTHAGAGSGPVAGTFQPGTPSSAPGGGGSAGIGVGGMQAAKAEPDSTAPRMADSRSNTAYSPGGGSSYVAGGVAAEKSQDLGFLANLLPKPQEEMGKNGILDYGNGRSPASAAPYSFLGRDVNIFQRVSDRTTAKLKSGDVGG